MGNCGTREESAVVVTHAQGFDLFFQIQALLGLPLSFILFYFLFLHSCEIEILVSNGGWFFAVQQVNILSEKKQSQSQNRTLSDLSDFEDSRKNALLYTHIIAFTLYELETITKSFRSDYILGEGGFGTVYKGYIDENVRVGLKSLPVAVKVLNKEGLQGHREWLVRIYIPTYSYSILPYFFF